MKYLLEIEIDLPRDRVIELFDNPDNMAKWQPGFVSMEHLSGTPGEAGAKSLLNYEMGKRVVEMTETIESRNLPDEFIAIYEAKKVWNRIVNNFIALDDNRTKWVFDCEFKMGGVMGVISKVMPGMFKKQSLENMQRFKEFAEGSSTT
ncbi:MAG: SRPBCC family protein [Chloroflexota bacterium]